jgi:hypothetical protein
MYKDKTHIRWTDNQHNVKFTFVSNDFHSSFDALSTTQALLNAYLKKRILPWCNMLTMYCQYNMITYTFFCKPYNPDNNKDGNKKNNQVIELGWSTDTIRRSQYMHIGYILKFQNALTRAMSWFTPNMNLKHEIIETTIIDDIKAGRYY